MLCGVIGKTAGHCVRIASSLKPCIVSGGRQVFPSTPNGEQFLNRLDEQTGPIQEFITECRRIGVRDKLILSWVQFQAKNIEFPEAKLAPHVFGYMENPEAHQLGHAWGVIACAESALDAQDHWDKVTE